MKLVSLGLALGVVACNPFDANQSIILEVTNLDAPATIAAGSQLTVVLTVTAGGCLTFDRIAVQRVESGAVMAALGRDASRGNSDITCPDILLSETHSYTFDPPIPSPFTIQVERGSAVSPLIATVLVQ